MDILIDIRSVLGWCALLNIILLSGWFGAFVWARTRIHTLHGRWFKLSAEQFDVIHYGGMAFFKIIIYVFNIIPWLALQIVI